VEFIDIVEECFLITHKLRVILIDKSFTDINLSKRLPGKFGFHWECRDAAGTIFRYDNFPDKSWENISTFPYHFHKDSQENVKASPFPLGAIDGFRAFMEFVRNKVKK
jgi:hypothetical protein